MTRDDITRMAREAAAQHGHTIKETDEIVETLTSFYVLAVAAEREACAEHYLGIMREAIKEEREACAKVAEAQGTSSGDRIAEAIRARSDT